MECYMTIRTKRYPIFYILPIATLNNWDNIMENNCKGKTTSQARLFPYSIFFLNEFNIKFSPSRISYPCSLYTSLDIPAIWAESWLQSGFCIEFNSANFTSSNIHTAPFFINYITIKILCQTQLKVCSDQERESHINFQEIIPGLESHIGGVKKSNMIRLQVLGKLTHRVCEKLNISLEKSHRGCVRK